MRLLSPLTILAILLGYQIVTVTEAGNVMAKKGVQLVTKAGKEVFKKGGEAVGKKAAQTTMQQGAEGAGSGAARVATKTATETGSGAAANAPKMNMAVNPVNSRPVEIKYRPITFYDKSTSVVVALAAGIGTYYGNLAGIPSEAGSAPLIAALNEDLAVKTQFPNGPPQLTELQKHDLQQYLINYQRAAGASAAAAATAAASEAQKKQPKQE